MPDASNFAFVRDGWADLYAVARQAERHARPDPRAACFYARLSLERAVRWIYDHDTSLPLPGANDALGTLLHEPAFKALLGHVVWTKARLLHRLGNEAVHDPAPVPLRDGLQAVRELYHVLYWLVRTYTEGAKPRVPAFDEARLPDPDGQPQVPASAFRRLEADLRREVEQEAARQREQAEALARREADLAAREAALQAALAEIERAREAQRAAATAVRHAGEAVPDPHDYDEASTRRHLIDVLLREAGWTLDAPESREHPVSGLPTPGGKGRVDYVLWGDDGRPLAVVEAKKASRDLRDGQTQAALYADALERQFGRRPVIFYTSGYETHLWDDAQGYPPRPVLGFYTRAELEALHHQRGARKALAGAPADTRIAGRPYQQEALRRVAEAFDERRRRALLVMATGTGKTRTAVALVRLLAGQGWIKRVLFLADRTALLKQAARAFRAHLPSMPQANLSEGDDPDGARLVFSTYPTMANAVDLAGGPTRRFTPGAFDLVIVDEAHRSVYNRYRVLFDYFDALLVGLTATPRDEVDRDTYRLFQLPAGNPTFAYELAQAVRDGFLVPPRCVEVPLKFPYEGVTYSDLSEQEREEYESKLVDEKTGEVLSRVESDAVNRWLFNEDTVDKALAVLFERGLKVSGGDRLGKTLVFARNHAHALFIKERFDLAYPALGGHFAAVIDSHDAYAQVRLDAFYVPEKEPVVAISVDMLDTGVDVPEVVNLVFFKPVRSRIKFHQMVGRGTRLRKDLFGPGAHKAYFLLFDLGGNLAFFEENVEGAPASQPKSVATRLFEERLHLAMALRAMPEPPRDLLEGVLDALCAAVAAMNPESILVRPHRRLRDAFAVRARWDALSWQDVADLKRELAPLPSEQAEDHERIRRFDLLVAQAQRARAEGQPVPDAVAERLRETARRLLEKTHVASVAAAEPSLQALAAPGMAASAPTILEAIRERVRGLAPLVTEAPGRMVYTGFEDHLGQVREVPSGALAELESLQPYRERVAAFVHEHEHHLAIYKLRHNEPLTASDLGALEALLFQAGAAGSREEFERAFGEQPSLGLFVRHLVGLDRTAAKAALGVFLDGAAFSAAQIRFLDHVVEELTRNGEMEVGRLYQSPFTDLHAQGPEGLFSDAQASAIVHALKQIRANAVA